MQWIEIPDLSARRLTLSSLLLGGKVIGSREVKGETTNDTTQVQFSIDRRFSLVPFELLGLYLQRHPRRCCAGGDRADQGGPCRTNSGEHATT